MSVIARNSTALPYEIWSEIYVNVFELRGTYCLQLDVQRMPSYDAENQYPLEIYWTSKRMELYRNLRLTSRTHHCHVTNFISSNITVHMFCGFRPLLDVMNMFGLSEGVGSKLHTIAVQTEVWSSSSAWSYDALTAMVKRFPTLKEVRIVEPWFGKKELIDQIAIPLSRMRKTDLIFDYRRSRDTDVQTKILQLRRQMSKKRPFEATQDFLDEDKRALKKWSMMDKYLSAQRRVRSLRSYKEGASFKPKAHQLRKMPLI